MPDSKLPQTIGELLEDIEREWSALMVTIEKLGSEDMLVRDAGGWSPKDNLAHLTEWMKVLLGYHMDKRPPAEVANMSFEDVKDWDFERMNKIFFERNRNRSLDDVVDELKLLYSEVVGRLESVAKARRIPLQHEAVSGTSGTDTDVIFWTRGGIASALVSLPDRYMHSPVEVISLKDLERIPELLAAFARSLKAREQFKVRI